MILSTLVPISLILIAGMPHGAADGALAVSRYQATMQRLTFFLAYIGAAIIGYLLWMLAPTAMLVVFLVMTVFHFGSGDARFFNHSSTAKLAAIAHGATLLIFMSIAHPTEISRLIAILIGAEQTAHVVMFMQWSVVVWSIAVLHTLVQSQEKLPFVLEIAAIIALSVVLEPLWSFCIYFCLIHSMRHFRNIYPVLKQSRYTTHLTILLTLLGLVLVAILYLFSENIVLSDALFQSTIIALFMLTIPHMIFIDYLKPVKRYANDR